MADHHNHHNHHNHQQGHEDSSTEKHDWTKVNKTHWDNVASTYNSTHTQEKFGDFVNKTMAFLLSNVGWIGVPFLDPASNFEVQSPSAEQSMRILDYACGPGTVTAAYAGYATEYVGLDLSENMVKEYNNRFNPPSADADNKTEKINAHAINADLLDPEGIPPVLEDEKYYNFDLAVVSGGFHHFENLELATQRLTDRLRPGGVFLIFDFLSHAPGDMAGDPALRTVVHHGFTEARIHELFSGAGLEEIEMKLMPEQILLRGTAWRQGFLAKGRKPKVQ